MDLFQLTLFLPILQVKVVKRLEPYAKGASFLQLGVEERASLRGRRLMLHGYFMVYCSPKVNIIITPPQTHPRLKPALPPLVMAHD